MVKDHFIIRRRVGWKISVSEIESRSCLKTGRRESGVALVAVLWTVVLLGILATTLITVFRSDSKILVAQVSRQQAVEAARAGINLALVELSTPGQGSPLTGTTRNFAIGNATVEVTIVPENGKIDLNTGNIDLVRGLLGAEGIGPGAADRFAEIIMERRISNSPSNTHQPFETIGDLMEMHEMTIDTLTRLSPNLTVYSGSSTVDTRFAPEGVILAIPGNSEADVEAAERARSSDAFGPGNTADLSQIIGHSFSLSATARLPNHTITRLTEVVRFTGNPKESVWILSSN